MKDLPGVVMNRSEQCAIAFAKHYTACTKVFNNRLAVTSDKYNLLENISNHFLLILFSIISFYPSRGTVNSLQNENMN